MEAKLGLLNWLKVDFKLWVVVDGGLVGGSPTQKLYYILLRIANYKFAIPSFLFEWLMFYKNSFQEKTNSYTSEM